LSNDRVIEYKFESKKETSSETDFSLKSINFDVFFLQQKAVKKVFRYKSWEVARTKAKTKTHHPETILFIYEFSQLKLTQCDRITEHFIIIAHLNRKLPFEPAGRGSRRLINRNFSASCSSKQKCCNTTFNFFH
jgi:hypothetical protein